MVDLLDPEQLVGRWWHRFAGDAPSYPSYLDAAAFLDAERGRLGVFYRALGGPGGIRLTAASRSRSSHRLTLRQRLGFGDRETLERPKLDGDTLVLPRRIDCFPERALNVQLYLWLAAFFAHADGAPPPVRDPLVADLLALRAAYAATRRTLARWPGLRKSYEALAAAVRGIRPKRPLGPWESAVEDAILHLLGDRPPEDPRARRLVQVIADPAAEMSRLRAPVDYRPYLPVPLWGIVERPKRTNERRGDEEPGGGSSSGDERRYAARRRQSDQTQRKDPLVLNRFEYLLSVAEMVNVNRNVEDDDADSAREAAETVDEISISNHPKSTASRLKLDLELPPQAVDPEPLPVESAYPEWDYTRQAYLRDHCRVIAAFAEETGDDWNPDAGARRRIRAVTRQFEALRPRRKVLSAQTDGDELDMSALVRSYADLHSGQPGSEHVYLQARNVDRDLAVAVLMDASLSTDGWVDNRRILDVEKEAVLSLSHGLHACGDDHAVFAFTSRSRRRVSVTTLKTFDEPPGERVRRRVQALEPGYYTRMGAALRHTTRQLEMRPNRHRLLLLLTDGKPNDMDHYEGRYGVEDTRRAIREARNAGMTVFGITVDKKAREYFPYIFGRGAFAIVAKIDKLPQALPAIYRQITA